ncbi:MAG TPA: hypothetical protein VIE89_02170 [Candidatus Binatia bacterium]|jgi:hypothetical protein
MSALFYLAAAMIFLVSSWFSPASAEMVMTEQQGANTAEIHYTTDHRGVISGKIINTSSHAIENPELLVQYHWLWAKEFKPGNNPPGRAAYITLDKEIQPGATASFNYRPEPPLPDRTGGRFVPDVSLAGFTSVMTTPQMTSSR